MSADATRLKSPPDGGRDVQFRLTRSSPPALPPCCLLSETVGEFLVSVTLLRLTPGPCAAFGRRSLVSSIGIVGALLEVLFSLASCVPRGPHVPSASGTGGASHCSPRRL